MIAGETPPGGVAGGLIRMFWMDNRGVHYYLYLNDAESPMQVENSFTGYLIWTGTSEIFSFESFTLRWGAVLFVLAFLVGRQVLLYLFKKDNIPPHRLSALCIYLVLAAMAGGRLGHLILYKPGSPVSEWFSVVLPVAFKPEFHILPGSEFSVHGAAVGVLLFLWIYSRYNTRQLKYAALLDRVALAALLLGAFLLTASFINSGITGKPTSSPLGVIFATPVQRSLLELPCCIMRSPDGVNPLDQVEIRRDPYMPKGEKEKKSIILYLFFKAGASERLVNEFLIGDVKTFLYEMSPYVHEPGDQPLQYRIFLEKNGNYIARIRTMGISRYPADVWEAISCLIVFVFLFRHYRRNKIPSAGRTFSLCLIIFGCVHLLFGFLRETQGAVDIGLNILFIVAGITALVMTRKALSINTVVGQSETNA